MFPRDKSKAPARGGVDVAALIGQLSDGDAAMRERAARDIFWHGRERAVRSAQAWLDDAELAACFAAERADLDLATEFPHTTVGIAVRAETFERIRAANGGVRLADVPADLDAMEFEIDFAGGTRLDVLTTHDENGDGAIARFLQKHGEGIQQVELSVWSVDRATELLVSRFGIAPVYPAARPGADGTRVNFFLVPDGQTGRLLIELVESRGERV
jgi:hypothetical protein